MLTKPLITTSSRVFVNLIKGSRIVGDNWGGENLIVLNIFSIRFNDSSLYLYTGVGIFEDATLPVLGTANPNDGNHAGIGTAVKLGPNSSSTALSVWAGAEKSGIRIWA